MAVGEVAEDWEPEDIPVEDYLFKRVPRNHVDEDGEPMHVAFRDLDMSTNWDRYSTAEKTRNEGLKPAHEYAVFKGCVKDMWAIEGLAVVHNPVDNRRLKAEPGHKFLNRAHTLVSGDKPKDRVRFKLARAFVSVIELQPPSTCQIE